MGAPSNESRLCVRSESAMERAACLLGVVARCGVTALTFPVRLVRRVLGARKSPELVREAPFAAAELAVDEGYGKLASALSDPDPGKRLAALDLICELSEGRAARLISSMLYDPEPTVRRGAAAAAARVRATGTVFALIIALDDQEPKVAEAAAQAIEAITGRRVQLEGDPEPRRAGLEQLKQWWKQQRVAELARDLGPQV